jgi:hypothetical protein
MGIDHSSSEGAKDDSLARGVVLLDERLLQHEKKVPGSDQ